MRSGIERREAIARWVAVHVMPHEADVRRWLLRSRANPDDADEIVQEAYCRLAALEDTAHIGRGDAYFFSIVRNLYLRHLKRAKLISFDTIAMIESQWPDESPSPERVAAGRHEMDRVLKLIGELPDVCRQTVYMRRVEGLSQKEIASRLSLSEKAVEKQVWHGIRIVRERWRAGTGRADDSIERLDRSRVSR